MCSIKLCKQTNTVLHSPVRPKQMLQQSGQETKASKTEAWGSRQYGAYSAHASLLSCARPPRDHPGGLPPPRRFCWESDSRTGTFPRADGIWAVGWLAFFPLSEPSDTGWEASHSKLHTRLKAELNCTAFMKHCRGKKKSIASHSKPLFMASYTKPLQLPGWATTSVSSSSVLSSLTYYIVKPSPKKTN